MIYRNEIKYYKFSSDIQYNMYQYFIFTVKLVSLVSFKYLAYIKLDKTEVNSRALKGHLTHQKPKKGPRSQGFLGPFRALAPPQN